MKRTTIWTCAALLLLLLSPVGRPAHGRPKYAKTFLTTYEKEFAGNPESTKCVVCHLPGDKKSLRNNYGDAVAESLRMRNVEDQEVVKQALRETEPKPSAIEGKTFGDLIREGRLPATR